ncbi:MAG: sensor histidine kinase [bacterium]
MRRVLPLRRRSRPSSGAPAERRRWLLTDSVVAAALGGLAVASAAFEPTEITAGVTRPYSGTAIVAVLAMTLPLAARRTWPRAVASSTTAVAVAAVLAGYPVGIGPFGAVFALHSLAYTTTNRTAVAVGAPCGLALLASLVWSPGEASVTTIAGNGLFILFALVAGVLLRAYNDQRDELVRKNVELTSAREAQVRWAVNEERLRIAREVHDAVGHALVAITLQTRTGQRRIDRDPAQVRAALAEIEELAQHALDETRSAVSSIHDGHLRCPAPRITTASLEELIRSMRGPEVDIELDVDVGDHELNAELESAAFRIVQESLNNVVKHAPPASAKVTIASDGTTLTVEVANSGSHRTAAAGSGSGIRGMRERTERLGGRFSAGPTSTGWRVHALLPAHRDEPTAAT